MDSKDDIEKIKKENEKLKFINENKSDLVSVSAHQLRTSLSALKWTLKMFDDGELGNINDEQKKYIGKAIESNEHAIDLVNYLLTFNNLEDTSMAFDFKKVSILDILGKVIDEFYGELRNKNIKLTFIKPATDIPDVKCDKEMITVAIQSLIENAIKYSQNNEEINIDLKYDPKNNEILISIHDQGIGIKKEDQLKIFNKFYRAPNAIKKETTGSGLGLFTTKSIVERHNGKIWFESSRESGTSFFILLPIS
ncbi:hypothetical protein A2467_00590 [Candidatus Nomurabacteria bacterium RIFOXYC2_FULL_36_8]|nr:MAG: Integral membrane sensor signal transduction histidine kinase [Candidatus Nomurabacteria bacterium GW2011_GWE2_36_115]KKP94512.1 MAG: Integral membrane sensor signal transduction histidine kinase [Candidatus Nomurabacteria bacterium GW2011_GWF2_36_126]KKP96974.1 MAG: Integral membrane sensor signal transduction histidine kinase [Candidatus Nomurabacteria bacterium GW2011_GWD2_36_14]KKP99422.1 MAG: Integral membrane sensor signal transduction histidine kinase [Candidatus Nomurabacteria ba